MKNNSFSSLDIKSLYINILVDKSIERLENHIRKTNIVLPLLASKLIKSCTLCTSHCYFQRNNTFYTQKFNLPLGSPVSRDLAYISTEFLESGPFKYIQSLGILITSDT